MRTVLLTEQELEETIERTLLRVLPQMLAQKKEKLYTVEETCERLRISPSTLSRMTKRGEIRAIRLTGRPTYSEDEINKVVLNGKG